jgi:GNAT superfamily N-acetyltransferase
VTDPDTAHLAGLAERDYQTYVEAYADTPGVEIVLTPEIRYRRGAAWPHEYLNAIFGTHVAPSDAARLIDDTIEVLGVERRAFYWTVWPSDAPSDLVERLVAAGFEHQGADPLMTLDLRTRASVEPVPPGIVVQRATTTDEIRRGAAFAVRSVGPEETGDVAFAATFERLAAEEPPRWYQFTGTVDGEIVASSGLFTGSGVAGIYSVATDEAHRGRGYGGAVSSAAVETGRALGLETAVLMASEMGAPVYRRLGFREVGRVHFLRWPGRTTG